MNSCYNDKFCHKKWRGSGRPSRPTSDGPVVPKYYYKFIVQKLLRGSLSDHTGVQVGNLLEPFVCNLNEILTVEIPPLFVHRLLSCYPWGLNVHTQISILYSLAKKSTHGQHTLHVHKRGEWALLKDFTYEKVPCPMFVVCIHASSVSIHHFPQRPYGLLLDKLQDAGVVSIWSTEWLATLVEIMVSVSGKCL